MSADPEIRIDSATNTASGDEESAQRAGVSRRTFLRAGLGGAGILGAAALSLPIDAHPSTHPQPASSPHSPHDEGAHPMPAVVGEVNHIRNGFNPTKVLTDFDTGMVTTMPNGQTLH